MMLFGVQLQCLEPTLVIAASLSFRSPFFSPFDKRAEADAAKKEFGGGGASDHLTVLHAYAAWYRARREGSRVEREFLRVCP